MLQHCNPDPAFQSFSHFIPSALAWIHHIDSNSCTLYRAQYITVQQLKLNQQIFLGAFQHYQTKMPLLIQVFWYNVSGKMMYQKFPTSWGESTTETWNNLFCAASLETENEARFWDILQLYGLKLKCILIQIRMGIFAASHTTDHIQKNW